MRKPGAIALAKPVLESEVGEVLRQFASGARQRVANPASEMARIMELMLQHGTEVVGQAVEFALRRTGEHPDVPRLSIPAVSLQAYDALLERK